MDEFMGIIKLFAGNFAPQGWLMCNGQILNISQYQALFSLLGTTYGGNGQTTFALPNLMGRAAVGAGQGPGLPNVVLGQAAGAASVTLLAANLPAHTHSMQVNTTNGTASNPSTGVPAVGNFQDESTGDVTVIKGYAATANATNATAIGVTGSGQAVSTMSPYLGLSYIICVSGIYPSRP